MEELTLVFDPRWRPRALRFDPDVAPRYIDPVVRDQFLPVHWVMLRELEADEHTWIEQSARHLLAAPGGIEAPAAFY